MVCTNYTWITKPGSNFTRYNFNIHNQELTVRYFKKLHRATLLNTNWFNEERIIHWLGGYSWNCAQKHRNIRQKLRSFWMWSSGCISVRESENICSLLVLRCSKKMRGIHFWEIVYARVSLFFESDDFERCDIQFLDKTSHSGTNLKCEKNVNIINDYWCCRGYTHILYVLAWFSFYLFIFKADVKISTAGDWLDWKRSMELYCFRVFLIFPTYIMKKGKMNGNIDYMVTCGKMWMGRSIDFNVIRV